jgi:hypothetical protein
MDQLRPLSQQYQKVRSWQALVFDKSNPVVHQEDHIFCVTSWQGHNEKKDQNYILKISILGVQKMKLISTF